MNKPANRTEMRRQLLQQRQALSFDQRRVWDARIIDLLREHLRSSPARKIAVYWPIRNEPDLRELMVELDQAGYEIGLPEVVIAHQPLRFLRWQRDQPLVSGSLGVPVPAHGSLLKPELMIVPCIGFQIDGQNQRYRLGYGGGYYDRTLAAEPITALGVAYECLRMSADAFKPGPHDFALNAIITENGVF